MNEEYVFGVDLDGVCADFYGKMREIVAFWRGVPLDELTPEPDYGLGNWGVPDKREYERIHLYHFHKTAVTQTAEWLDKHAIPYWDLCFMREKGHINAHIYVDDTETHIRDLENGGRSVIAFTNSTNVHMDPPPALRANSWAEAESIVRSRYRAWRATTNPPAPGSPDAAPPEAA